MNHEMSRNFEQRTWSEADIRAQYITPAIVPLG
jgi:hypothetical protein